MKYVWAIIISLLAGLGLTLNNKFLGANTYMAYLVGVTQVLLIIIAFTND